MKSYKILALRDEFLLLQLNKGEYSTTLIDKGDYYQTIEKDLIVGIRKEDGRFNYYLADEESQTLSKIADNVYMMLSFDDPCLGKAALYQIGNCFELMKLDSMEKIDLGSWLEKGFFLSGKEGSVKVRFFLYGASFTERDYVSVNFWGVVGDNCAAFCLRKDGLYDIFRAPNSSSAFEDSLNVEEVKKEYVRVLFDENNLDMCRIYFYDEEREGYVQIFEGENRINFDNAILEFFEPVQEKSAADGDKVKTKAILYLLEGTEKILLAQTDDVEGIEFDELFVIIGDKKWNPVKDDLYLLDGEPQKIEDEAAAEEDEEENISDKDNTYDGGDKATDETENKKSGWWSWLKR